MQGCGVSSGKNRHVPTRLRHHWVPWRQGRLRCVVLYLPNHNLEMKLTIHQLVYKVSGAGPPSGRGAGGKLEIPLPDSPTTGKKAELPQPTCGKFLPG